MDKSLGVDKWYQTKIIGLSHEIIMLGKRLLGMQ